MRRPPCMKLGTVFICATQWGSGSQDIWHETHCTQSDTGRSGAAFDMPVVTRPFGAKLQGPD